MVAAPRSLAPLPRELAINVFYVDGGHSRISDSTSQGGPPSTFFYIDGRRSRISGNTSQGAHHLCFLALMMGALGFVVSPPRGSAIDIFCVDSGCSQIFVMASQGGRHQYFYVDGGPPWEVLSEI
jgi:hypothetical protein